MGAGDFGSDDENRARRETWLKRGVEVLYVIFDRGWSRRSH